MVGLAAILGMFALLVYGLADLQLSNSDSYQEMASSARTKKIVLRGKRGNITDADSVILAEDQLIYNVTFYKDVSMSSKANYQTFTSSIIDAIGIIERNGGTLAIKFNIERDEETGEWVFNFGDPERLSQTVLDKRESQWRSNNYLAASRYPTAQSCIEKLYDRYQFETVMPNISEDLMCKVMAIYCEMQMNVFSSQPIVIAKDVNYETVIEVETRSMMLSGMEIAVGTKRVYPKSTLFLQ